MRHTAPMKQRNTTESQLLALQQRIQKKEHRSLNSTKQERYDREENKLSGMFCENAENGGKVLEREASRG